MAKTTVRGQISDMIREVERAAKQIRNEVRKQYKATPKVLDQAASQLRRGAAEAAYQVERYIHEVRLDLEAAAKRKTTGAKRATKKRTTKKRATKKRAAKKTAAKKSTKKRARKR
jgi:hypothetical protein